MNRYVHRAIEEELKKAEKEFPVIILTGARQTGKSTVLQKTFTGHHYVTLDDPLARRLAHEDPKFFLSRSDKMIIDEIQYLPELLPYIKMAVDTHRRHNGRFILTGSQYFPLMAGISESLAGRAALYQLLGFSIEETPGLRKLNNPRSVFMALFRGFFPEIVVHGVDRDRFYASYLQTYLERDIRQITSVHDLRVFQNFLELLAGRAGSLLNLNEICKECGISFSSSRRWLSLLESTNIIYLLRSYTRNISKRLLKSPKIYFSDTGLLSYLLRYQDAMTMQNGPQAGAFFENLIIGEILKYKFNHNMNFELYFYRDSNYNEIDVILDFGTYIKLIEIKTTATALDKHLSSLKKIIRSFKNAQGYLVNFSDHREMVAKDITVVPWMHIIDILKPAK